MHQPKGNKERVMGGGGTEEGRRSGVVCVSRGTGQAHGEPKARFDGSGGQTSLDLLHGYSGPRDIWDAAGGTVNSCEPLVYTLPAAHKPRAEPRREGRTPPSPRASLRCSPAARPPPSVAVGSLNGRLTPGGATRPLQVGGQRGGLPISCEITHYLLPLKLESLRVLRAWLQPLGIGVRLISLGWGNQSYGEGP